MMNNNSPFVLVKQLQGDVLRLLSQVDVVELGTAEKNTITQIQHVLMDARLEVQDYEMAETRADQLLIKEKANEYLAELENLIIANPANAFGPVDVAHLTARSAQISDRLT